MEPERKMEILFITRQNGKMYNFRPGTVLEFVCFHLYVIHCICRLHFRSNNFRPSLYVDIFYD
jgi:hypothetical protein